MDKDTRQLLRRLDKQKFQVEYTGSGHYKVYSPDRTKFVIMPSTPSDRRGMIADIVRLRKIGYKHR